MLNRVLNADLSVVDVVDGVVLLLIMLLTLLVLGLKDLVLVLENLELGEAEVV